MLRPFSEDRKLVWLVVLLAFLLVLMVVIWRYYDIELKKIDKQMNESKVGSKAIEAGNDR